MNDRFTPINILRGIIVLLMGSALVVALSNPLGEAPDEPAHFDYARFVVVNQRLPHQCAAPCQSDVPGEGHQPPLAYVVYAGLTWPLIDTSEWVPQAINPHFIWQGGDQPQALVHGTREQWPWQGTFLAWRLMRLISVLLVLTGCYFVWRAGLAISTPTVALLAVALLASSPQTSLIAGAVSNDALLFCLAAIITDCTLRARTYRDVGVLGLVIGAALITKQSAIMLMPVVLWPLWQYFVGWRRLWALLWAGIPLVLIAGWWYVRNQLVYGDVFGLTLFRSIYQQAPLDFGQLRTWQQAFSQLMRSGWGMYGWMSLAAPDWWLQIGATITLSALAGLLIHVGSRRPIAIHWWLLGTLWLMASIWLISFAYTVGPVAWQMRLIMSAVPAGVLLLTKGLVTGIGINPKPIHIGLAVCIAILCQIGIWWSHVLPQYQAHMPAATVTAQPLATATEAVFVGPTAGGGIALLDYTLTGQLAAGQALDLQLRWLAQTRPVNNWQVFVWVINAEKKPLLQLLQPLDPQLPTSAWSPGDRLYSSHQFTIPADLPAGQYVLQIGLFDPAANLRAHKRNYAEKLTGDSIRIPFVIPTP
ncbi:MAG: hypothetical protein EBS29_09190 [Chloroflexia bacterium]|nr:hypothetical protein [Chloroflexia bacterium]